MLLSKVTVIEPVILLEKAEKNSFVFHDPDHEKKKLYVPSTNHLDTCMDTQLDPLF